MNQLHLISIRILNCCSYQHLVGILIGLVTIFSFQELQAQTFNEILKAVASDAQNGDQFGLSVSISGDYAIVGAPTEDTGGSNAGAVYIFKSDLGGIDQWGEVAKIQASDLQSTDGFGKTVSISGDYAIVGTPTKNGTTGAAYIFKKDQGGADNWGEVLKLQSSDLEPTDRFGVSVSISGDYAVVGADLEDTGGTSTGAAYIFKKDLGGADNWGELLKIQASDKQALEGFGRSVSVAGDHIIVGVPAKDAGAGAAYIFKKDQGGADNWGEVAKIQASDKQANDFFGFSVSISGDYAIGGAYLERTGGNTTGAAYIFKKDQGGVDNWGQVTKIQASDKQNDDQFGTSVSISDGYAMVGSPAEDTGGGNTGAAYIFKKDLGGADNWGELIKIQASDKQTGDSFGSCVSITDGYALGAAYLEDAGGSSAGAAYIFKEEDLDADGYTIAEGDCDDLNPSLYPGNTEICDGIDNNCNSFIDEGVGSVLFVDLLATGANNGSSWVDAFTNLSDALSLPNTTSCNISEIWVAKGTYYPTTGTNRNASFSMVDGVGIYGGFDGTETLRSQRDWVNNITLLSGEIGDMGTTADNSLHVVRANGVGSDAILDGFSITAGRANMGVNNKNGGGLTVTNGSTALIIHCTLFANRAQRGGGAHSLEASPTFDKCVFKANTASDGGAIRNGSSNTTIINSLFIDNIATDKGGGMENEGSGLTTIINCTFANNTGQGRDIRGNGSSGASTTVVNSILNSSSPISGNVTVSYSITNGNIAGTGNINSDPLFVEPANDDYRLQACSPAIDAATATNAPTDDLGGNPRPVNATYDIGAYEFQGTQPLLTCYADMDADGYGNPDAPQTLCGVCTNGFVEDATDCDDTKAARNPGLSEICDGLDNDCDDVVDEGFEPIELMGTSVDNCVSPFCFNVATIEICGGAMLYPFELDLAKEGFVKYAMTYNSTTGCASIAIKYSEAATWDLDIYSEQDCSGTVIAIDSENIEIGETLVLVISSINMECATPDSHCLSGGRIDLQIAGGTPPYNYSWGGPTAVNNTATATDLASGWYQVFISDASSPQQSISRQIWVACERPGRDCGSNAGKVAALESSLEASLSIYPNPFQSQARLTFSIAKEENAQLTIFNIESKPVAILFDGKAAAGQQYTLNLQAEHLPDGIYIARLTTSSGQSYHQRMVITKGQ